MRRARKGFTLVEIIVAMTVGAIVLVGVRQAAVAVADLSDATLARARAVERAANGERSLRQLVGAMQPDSNSTGGLVGDATHAEFDAWCEALDGWQERGRVALSIESDSAAPGMRLVARASGSRAETLIDSNASLAFCYLLDAGEGGRWRTDWDGRLALPLALGVVTGGDTLLVPVGVRE